MRHLPTLLLLCLPVMVATTQRLAADQPPTVTIVFDGSGSIWGKLEGTKAAKLDVAKEAVKATLSKSAGQSAIGLASYGHRRRGDCSDAEVIIAPEAGTSEAIGAALDKLNPRGKGPISLAVREAARNIGARRPASIVLITDNADNCRADFCEMGDELAKSQPGLAVHVVGIALEPDEIAKTQCVARATGGRFYAARDHAQLATTIDEVLRLALKAGAASQASAEPQLVAAPQPAQRPQPPAGRPGLAAVAGLGADGPQWTAALRWSVLAADGGATKATANGPALTRSLPAGKYVVTAEGGVVSARLEVEVGAGEPTEVRLALPAGALKLAARHVKDPAMPAVVSVYLEGGEKTAAPVLVSRDIDSELMLPPGSYRLRIEQGAISRDLGPISVTAGKVSTVEAAFQSARLELTAAATGDSPPLDGAMFVVAREDKTDQWHEIARSSAKAPYFLVSPGSYRITARLGPVETHQRIALGAGETANRSLVLGMSVLELAAVLPKSLTGSFPLTYRLHRLDGTPGVVAESSAARPKLALAAGRYRVEVRAGAQNVFSEETVTVSAGRDIAQSVAIAAGSVDLRLTQAASDVYWEVADNSGRVVWRTSSPEARGLLAPGRYVVRAESRDRRFERTFDLANGEARTIEVGGS